MRDNYEPFIGVSKSQSNIKWTYGNEYVLKTNLNWLTLVLLRQGMMGAAETNALPREYNAWIVSISWSLKFTDY